MSALVPRDKGVLDTLRAQVATRFSPRQEALLLLLDASGAMGGEAWDALVEAVGALATASNPATCRLGAAVFSQAADLIQPFTADLGQVVRSVERYEPGGGTGMKEGLALAEKLQWPENHVRRVVLFSDGMPTTGDPVPTARRLGDVQIVVDTVGCGEGVDEDTLRAIAKAGGGRYVHAASVRDLVGVFLGLTTEARGLLTAGRG